MRLPEWLYVPLLVSFTLTPAARPAGPEMPIDAIEVHKEVTPEIATKLQIEGSGNVVYADQGGPFVMFGGAKFPEKESSRNLYSLVDGKLLGTIPTTLGADFHSAALSPSGQYFAAAKLFGDKVFVFGPECTPLPEITVAAGLKEIMFFSDDRLALIGKDSIAVWDLAKNALDSTIALPNAGPFAKRTISPNAKVIVTSERNSLLFHDSKARRLAALNLPSGADYVGGAFHPGGKKMAVVLGSFRNQSVGVLDITTGKFGAMRDIPAPELGIRESRVVQWSAAGDALLLHERYVFDIASGRTIWEFPVPDKGVHGKAISSPNLFSLTHGVYLAEAGKVRVLKGIVHDDDKIAQIKKSVQSGASLAAAQFPKLTEASLKGVRNVVARKAAGSWQVKPQRTELIEMPRQRIPLDFKIDAIGEITFAPKVGRAYVDVLTESSPRFGRREHTATKSVAILNIAEALRSDAINVPFASRFRTVSPEGGWLALTDVESDTRLDILSTDGGKHVVGFRPYAQDLNSPQIRWVRFVGDNKILTSNGTRLVIWNIPSCKAEVQMLSANHTLELSPDGKFLAVASVGSVRLLDAATLQTLGELPLPKIDANCNIGFRAMAFDPHSEFLATLCELTYGDQQVWTLVWNWNLTTGKLNPEIRTAGGLPTSVELPAISFVDSERFLVNNTYLVAAGRDEPIWTFESGAEHVRHAIGSLDGRHWYATALSFAEMVKQDNKLPDRSDRQLAILLSAELAKTSVLEWVKRVDDAPKIWWKAGGELSVDVQLGGDAEQIKKALVSSFARQGTKIVDGSPNRLNFSETEHSTGDVRVRDGDAPRFSPGKKGGIKENVETVGTSQKDVRAELIVNDRLLWSAQAAFRSGREPLIILNKGETVSAHFQSQLASYAAGWAARVNPPRLIVESNDGVVMALPGKGHYTATGVTIASPVLKPIATDKK